MAEWSAELVDLFRGPVELQAGQIGEREHFTEDGPDVLQVVQHPGGPGVAFAAEDLVVEGRKLVEQAERLAARLVDELFQQAFHLLPFAGMGFEIRMDGDEVGGQAHGLGRTFAESPVAASPPRPGEPF